MIFKIKEKVKPKDGSIKIITKFAWFPIKINENTIIWLEKYYIKYKAHNENYISRDDMKIHYKTNWIEIESWFEEKEIN